MVGRGQAWRRRAGEPHRHVLEVMDGVIHGTVSVCVYDLRLHFSATERKKGDLLCSRPFCRLHFPGRHVERERAIISYPILAKEKQIPPPSSSPRTVRRQRAEPPSNVKLEIVCIIDMRHFFSFLIYILYMYFFYFYF